MNSNNTIMQKIVAIVLVIALITLNMPKHFILADNITTDEKEKVSIDIIVIGAENQNILNAKFQINGEDCKEVLQHETSENDNLSPTMITEKTNKYTLTFDKPIEGEEVVITATEDGNPYHIASTIYKEGDTTYDVTLKRYIVAEIDEGKLDFSLGNYSYTTDYKQDDKTYRLKFNTSVDCRLVSANEQVTLSVGENKNEWYIDSQRPGVIELDIRPVDSELKYEDSKFTLTLNNKLKFLSNENIDKYKEDDTVTIQKSKSDDSVVSKVEKVISSNNESFYLELSSEYKDSVTYSLNEGAVSKIDPYSGNIRILACETLTVTATCNITGVKASYELDIKPTENPLKVKLYNGDYLSYGDEITIPIFHGEYDYILMPEIKDDNKYGIIYESSDENVVTIDNTTGVITIHDMSVDGITITVKATPKSNAYYYDESTFVFKVLVAKGSTNVSAFYGIGEDKRIIDDDFNITLYDNADKTDITENKDGQLIIDLPITANVSSLRGDINSYNIGLSSSDAPYINFDGTAITNPDDIVRNEPFNITITVSDTWWSERFTKQTFNITVTLEGNKTNNENNIYYTTEGLHEGFDGHLWKDVDSDVIVTGNIINKGLENEYSYLVGKNKYAYVVKPTYTVECETHEPYNKQHSIFVMHSINGEFKTTRLFFGVDSSLPNLVELTYDENTKSTPYGIYSNDSVNISLNAYDKDDNLYDAILNIDGKTVQSNKVVKTENGNGTFTFTLDKEIYKGLNKNVSIIIRDVACNQSEAINLGNILIEETPSTATIELSADNEAVIYYNDNKKYASADVALNISVSDILTLIDDSMSSGIASYEVYINGIKEDGLSKSFTDNDMKVTLDTFVIYTGDYEKNEEDNSITIEIRNIYDIAGNRGEDAEYTIYIDEQNPTATYEGATTYGNENITSFGNFYNRDVTFTFAVTDNMTGIKAATLVVGEKEFHGIVSDGKVSFNVPVASSGNVSLILMDNVEHKNVIMLNEIKNEMDINVFTNSYTIIENNSVADPFKDLELRPADKGNWYKSEVAYDLVLSDEVDGLASSGLSLITIYINDKEYLIKEYNGKYTITDTINIMIDNQWIEDVINNEGSYTVKLVVKDNAGNENTYSKTVYIDTVAPVISDLTGVVDGSVNTGTVTVNVELFEKHYKETGNSTVVNVTKTLDGQTTTYEADKFVYTSAKTTKPYTFTADGTYEVVVTSEDAAGNVAVQKQTSFVIDNTAPLAEISGVNENRYYLKDTDVTIRVIESNFEDTDVKINITRELNGETFVIESQTFTGKQKDTALTQTFADEGTYTIKVDAVDIAGNTALTKTVIFTIDTSAPTIKITGVEDGMAYKNEVIPSIVINDNYYKNYSINLVKTGVYFNSDRTNVNSMKEVDVTDTFIQSLASIENGVEGTFDTFERLQDNDGIYTLTVTATDLAGRTSTDTLTFSVNRFGSVYVLDDNLKNVIGTYRTAVDNDLVITEYNADKLFSDSVKVSITRDGSILEDIIVDSSSLENTQVGESGWYQYKYVISKENFKYDGVYVITVSSTDEAGNSSESITYDKLTINFAVDTTKPELVKVTGLSKDTYNAEQINVEYAVFDAISIKEVRVYLNNNVIQTITEFYDITSYEGSFSISEGVDQSIRFEVEDIAGNMVDSANAQDIKAGKIADFNEKITVSTSFFVRWYVNKPLFYGTIIGAAVVITGCFALILTKRRKKTN